MSLPRPRAPIPVKLLLASSLLALIPWIGLQYVRELERLLRSAQDQGLVATARAVATTLNDRPNLLLSGEVYSLPGDGPDLRVPNLAQPIVLDGRVDDWRQPGVVPIEVGTWTSAGAAPFSFRYRVGRHGGGVYAVFEVEDAAVVLRDPARPEVDSDHLEVVLVTPQDELLRFALDAAADGPLQVWVVRGETQRLADDRIEGVWRTTAGGYVVELRIPRSLVGPRLSFAVADVDDPQARTLVGVHATSGTGSRESLGTVLVPSPEISELIRGLGRARSRIWVVDANRRVLAPAGSLRPPPVAAEPERLSTWDRLASWVRPLTRPLLSEPREDFQDVEPGTYRLDWPEVEAALAGRETTRTRRTRDGRAEVVSAAAPIWVEDHVRGAVVVEETTNEILAVRNRGFEKLFAAILSVSLLGATALFVVATRLSLRIRRLRDDVERAVDPRGRVTGTVHGTGARDELGDLARSFAAILDQQRQHASYLEQVGRRLSHEIRTPVGVVRSSLDNLSLGELPQQQRVYIERAEEGLRRLATILSRMSEASRLEQVLQASEREPFDLGLVVRGCVEGYRLANPGRAIELRLPLEALLTLGAPDLIAQLLDKLVENALGFARPGTPIVVSLARHGRMAALSVSNSGPRLPAEMEGRLFESMVSVRPAGSGTTGEPHLGFGLYIARLIAQFHGGTAAAHDRPDGDGVIVTVTLPLQQEGVAKET